MSDPKNDPARHDPCACDAWPRGYAAWGFERHHRRCHNFDAAAFLARLAARRA